jgi:hypothetical protein
MVMFQVMFNRNPPKGDYLGSRFSGNRTEGDCHRSNCNRFQSECDIHASVSKKAITAKDGPQTWRVGGATSSRNSKQHVDHDMLAGALWRVVWYDLRHWFPHPFNLRLPSCEQNISGPPERNYLTPIVTCLWFRD